MHITLCVDALESQLGGIGRYTLELGKRVGAHEDVSDLSLFTRDRLFKDLSQLRRGRRRSGRFSRSYHRWRTARALASSVVHAPNYFLPNTVNSGVITVHDLSVFRYPEMHPAERIKAFERHFMSSLDRATHIITDTESIKRELTHDFPVAPETVTSVPLGVDERFAPRTQELLSPVLQSWRLQPFQYGLCVSAFEPRKKISELIDAWRILPPTYRERFPLVLAGGSGWLNEDLEAKAKKGLTEGWLIVLGFVDDRLLPFLYAGAALFVYPSIYEGFGLPPLEAMASGVPIIVAKRSCLPEVCGDAARYADPDDPAELSSAIGESLVDQTWRSESRIRGLERSALFSWGRCVEETVAVYRKVADSR